MPSLPQQLAPRIEDYAFSSLLAYAVLQWPGYRVARHHELIADALQRVERGEIKRLMIFMPPRHGKSMLASEYFPAWYLGRNPDRQIIHVTYAKDLALDFGRKVRNQIKDTEIYPRVFGGVTLSDDSAASDRFNLSGRGVYHAVGIGGAVTGRGADLMLIDDPIKGRDDADSELYRRRMKDWYQAVAYTRLMPGGAIVLIQCMTGDTPVLMADGSEHPLRTVRPGDRVATFSGGEIKTATVINHASQGLDDVYEIKTNAGKVVKANSRHPFLVNRKGSLTWVKVKNLKVGDAIVRAVGSKEQGRGDRDARSLDANGQHMPEDAATFTTSMDESTPLDTRENGQERHAKLKGAKSQHDVAECAVTTTNEQSGPADIEPHQALIKRRSETGNLGIDMGSVPPSTMPCSLSREVSAPFVSGPMARGHQDIGKHLPSITAMRQGVSGGCSATTATSSSAADETSRFCSAPLSIYTLTVDTVAEIRPAGREEVFDIQVDGTENFIANGLVSHNTRWHHEDLAGWLLDQHAEENWHVLNLPAINERGEALWPESFPIDTLQNIKAAVGSRDWNALYQQQPTPDEGGMVKLSWFGRYDTAPERFDRIIHSWDTAQKSKEINDPTAGLVIGEIGRQSFLLDVIRERMEYPDLKRRVIQTAIGSQYPANAVLIEDKASGISLAQELRLSPGFPPVIALKVEGDKELRMHRATPTIEAGNFFLPSRARWLPEFESEIAAFPLGKTKDQGDALSQYITWAFVPRSTAAVSGARVFANCSI